MFSDKINKEIEASNQKQTEDFMQMITVLTNYWSNNCFNFKDINLLNTDEENDWISRCANISNRISNSVQNEIQLAAANPLMFSKYIQ